MNKQLSWMLHSLLISVALFTLMPAELRVQLAPVLAQQSDMTPQSPRVQHSDIMLVSFGRGIPRSRAGGGTR